MVQEKVRTSPLGFSHEHPESSFHSFHHGVEIGIPLFASSATFHDNALSLGLCFRFLRLFQNLEQDFDEHEEVLSLDNNRVAASTFFRSRSCGACWLGCGYRSRH
jgi:hypothetical protein